MKLITNGDAAAELLRRCSFAASHRVIPWRESWIDGPRPLRWWEAEEAEARAAWFEREFGVPMARYIAQCREQHAELVQGAAAGEELMLWFEYDLFDQSMLAALLYRLWSLNRPAEKTAPLKLSWVIAETVEGVPDFRGLGQLTPEQLTGLWPQRKPVSEKELAAGARAWAAYADGSASAIEAWLREDGSVLPVMAAALRFELERLPAFAADGLGVVERETLRALAAEQAMTPDKLFGKVSAALPMLGMGDLSYWSVLNRMAEGDHPQLVIDGEEPLPGFDSVHPIDWRKWRIRRAA
ncbi:hypothetical protein [Paenibacillus montanisoli]|uniref:DUF1835 domain-containing protein n=1 Tax=Paenibacillus montanisoli TaxID=2081970 RepID=A0A328U2V1_9BACL|nr:hypothetical protein [Paenibacillus montanisoli]RAP75215.1 hypothetical protein DL346_17725 [Paenibacillus montanisoli]